MSAVTLSICIATRNRAGFIGATLESILCQANEQVEVVVLDGASADNTEEVVRRYQEHFRQLRYLRQEKNSGLDRDFAKAVESSRGEYCWLFCDDDLFKPGAIEVVLDAIRAGHVLIIANSEIRSADLSTLLESRRMRLEANRVYLPGENECLFSDVADYLSFIGGVIVKREIWDERNKEKYFGSYFIHVGVIFQQSLPGTALVLADPLISIRYENASWLGRYFEIWMFRWPELIWSFPDIPDSAKSQVCPREPWQNPKTLFHFRAKGAYTRGEYAELIKPRAKSYWIDLVGNAIANFPGRVANLLVFVRYYLFRHTPLRLLYLSDLSNSPFCFWKMAGDRLTREKTGAPLIQPAPSRPAAPVSTIEQS